MSATGQPASVSSAHPVGRGRWLSGTENVVLTLAFALIVLLPLAEIAVRQLGGTISGVTSFVQNLTLVVGMLGGAVAARESRLLALATTEALPSRIRAAARIATGAVAATITFYLLVASFKFVQVEQEAGLGLAYGIPLWWFELVMPVGFALVGARILWHSSSQWLWRLVSTAAAAGMIWIVAVPLLPPEQLFWPALGLLLVATVLGAPIFTVLGGAALILFWGADVPIATVSVAHYGLATNWTLPAVPLFTLAGYLLAESGAPRRLVRLFDALVGQLRGGPAILTALVCAFFTSFTGASGVTILALGGLLMPVLVSARYSERTALGLLTATGSLGLLLPPCLPLILYAVIAQVDIKDMFLGGMIPGTLIVLMTALWGISRAPRDAFARRKFDWREARHALWEAKWELAIPIVAVGGLFSGLATPVEAAALTAFYTFLVETFIYRDLRIVRDLPRVVTECGLLVGGVLLILGVALGFTDYLVDAQVPAQAVEWVTASVHSPWAFLLLLNLFLIVVGALMDIYSAIVIIVPLIVPIGATFGIDPIHLGIVFLANAELGYLMPPVGENLFLSALRFRKPIGEVFVAVVPMMLVFLIVVVLVTYIPALTLTLPAWFGS